MRMLLLWARSSPALYLTPLGVGFVFYVTGDDTAFQPRSWSEAFNLSFDVLFYTAGIGAACASWDLGRLRRGAMRTLLPVRRQATVVTLALLPSLMLAFLLQAVLCGMIIARLATVTGSLPWTSIGTLACTLLAWVLAGAALGWTLPPLIATPLTAGLAFIVMAYSAAASDPMWRNITGGALVGCCEVDEVARPEVWWATLLPVAGLALASLIMLALHRNTGRGIAAAAIVATAIGFAMPYGTAIGWEPTKPRDQGMRQCEAAAPELEVCLWPEYDPMRADLTADILAVDAAFEAYGVERPSTVVQSGQIETGQWTFIADPSFTETEFRHSVAYGLRADNYQSCRFQAMTDYGPLLSEDVRLVMADWLDQAILADANAAGFSDGTAFEPFLDHLHALSPADQGTWFNGLNQALRNCDEQAVPVAFANAAETAAP